MEGSEGGTPPAAAEQPAPPSVADPEPGELEALEAEPVVGEPPPKRKLKVYGEEIEVDDAELVTLAQKGKAADTRLREVAEANKAIEHERQQMRNLAEALQADPFGVGIQLMGEEKFWAKLKERFDYAELSPAERAKLDGERQTKTKAQLYDEQLERHKEAQRAEQYAAQVGQQRQIGQAGILKALQGVGVPASDWSVGRMAYLAGAFCRENDCGADKVPYDEFAADVKGKLKGDRSSHYASITDDEQLLADLEEHGVLDRVRKALVGRYKTAAGTTKAGNGVRKTAPAVKSTEEYFDALKRR